LFFLIHLITQYLLPTANHSGACLLGRWRWDCELRAAQAKIAARPCLKNKIQTKMAGDIAQMEELLPSIYKTLGSITSTEKKIISYQLCVKHKEMSLSLESL
jgi:hypothetical protein